MGRPRTTSEKIESSEGSPSRPLLEDRLAGGPPIVKPRTKQPRMPAKLAAKNALQKAQGRERGRVAVAMRSQGYTYEQIRVQLGLKRRKTIGKIIAREANALAEMDPNVEQERRVRVESLDERERRWRKVVVALSKRATSEGEDGESPLTTEQVLLLAKAENALAVIHDQRVKLQGLDKRESVNVLVHHQLEDLLDRVQRHLGAETYERVLALFVDPATAQGVLKGVLKNLSSS